MQSILSVLRRNGALAEPAPATAGLGVFQTTVQAMALPLWGHLAFNGLGCLAGALLGHPIIALAGFAAAGLADAAFQAQIARWRGEDSAADAEALFPKLAWCCAARACVLLTPAVLVALDGGLAETAYFATVACSLVIVALANGLLSGRIILAYAGPTLAAMLTIILAKLHGLAAMGAGVGLLSLALLLLMIGACLQMVLGGWRESHEASRVLAVDLAAAHAVAVAEKLAAEEAREEARRAHAAKANFLATMSHEIRTPMNGVMGMASLLMRGEADAKQKERIATLIQSGEYLLAILNDILDVSKIDAGKLELDERPESLPDLLREAVLFWEPRADEKGVRLLLEMDGEAPTRVCMDALRVRQVLFNLLGNALKFTDAGQIVCRMDGRPAADGRSLVHIVVGDTGPGIHPDQLPHLFTQFEQGDAASIRRFGGTGLGLSIARQLVELMGGRIWAESEVGRGADFHVEIPFRLALQDASPPPTVAEPEATQVRPLDVLIVDDNATNLLVLNQILSVLDHRVSQASDGLQALAQLAARPFDLVVMDDQMPGMTGVETLGRLQATEGPNRRTPVIVLTADVTSGGRERYLGLGFTEHCTKPIQVERLLGAIAAATATTEPSPARAKIAVGA